VNNFLSILFPSLCFRHSAEEQLMVLCVFFYQQQILMLHFTYDAWSYVMALIPFHFIATLGNNPLIFWAQKCSCTDGELPYIQLHISL